jgi:hypothetical protein
MEWFRKGAEKGSAKAQLNLGKALLGPASAETDRQEGLEWTKKAADQGFTEAELSYGSMLYFGDRGIPKNETQAAIYLERAAQAGNPDAQNMIGIMAEMGLGTPKDKSAAEQWFRKAALQGQSKAQASLGRTLWSDLPTQEIRIEALAWLLIANGQGEIIARKLLDNYSPGLKLGELDAADAKATELKKRVVKKRPSI